MKPSNDITLHDHATILVTLLASPWIRGKLQSNVTTKKRQNSASRQATENYDHILEMTQAILADGNKLKKYQIMKN